MKKLLFVLLAFSIIMMPVSVYSFEAEDKKRIVKNQETLEAGRDCKTQKVKVRLNKNTVTAIAIICATVLAKEGMIFAENVKRINLEANSPGLLSKIFKGMPDECRTTFCSAFSLIGFNKLQGLKNILFQVLNGAIMLGNGDKIASVWNYLKDNVGNAWNYVIDKVKKKNSDDVTI